MSISEQLRQAVDNAKGHGADGGSRYAICKRTGWFVSQSQLSGFMSESTRLSQPKIDALAEALGLELVKRSPTDAAETPKGDHTDAT